ncbi:hypothetical protein ASC92_11755 [Variovorax sp. Root411]|nr:hypothetical protein ASC92_11755 [Variovorax sp. Root411]
MVGTRVSFDTRARFAALAARHQLSESSLLAKMIEEVLKANGPVTRGPSLQRVLPSSFACAATDDRITLRLRPGDRTLAAERASARGMKPGGYLAMLVHNHVRSAAVLPPGELSQIKAVGAQLAALGRQLRVFGMPNSPTGGAASDELVKVIMSVRREVESAREATAVLVRHNILSWETSGERGHG